MSGTQQETRSNKGKPAKTQGVGLWAPAEALRCRAPRKHTAQGIRKLPWVGHCRAGRHPTQGHTFTITTDKIA